ncbi:hypothetical protein SACC_12190 [Saccharolobus caldissimus]|uniref:Transposase IS200-like domain-containing protein n=4 Tax=Sulfolobaceae TaxID=118883 RepID=A0AAQ4CQX1_9CREN|nr:hypothetical protein SACC_12190 [Saccharolobus caldissimus]
MLVGEVTEYIKEILKSIAEELGCEIITLEVMPDHIHLFVNCPPRYSPSYLANYFKGKSARLVLKKFPELRKYTNPVRVRLVILCQKELKVCFIMFIVMSISTSAEIYYEEAEEFLSKGDLVQACEKYYKAAEEAIKLLVIENNLKEIINEAEEHGWDSKTLNDAVTELSYKLGDNIIDMWASAVTLFTARKFMDKDLIENYKKDIKTLIEEAKQRFSIKVLK